jgi:hypothetical protein
MSEDSGDSEGNIASRGEGGATCCVMFAIHSVAAVDVPPSAPSISLNNCHENTEGDAPQRATTARA